MPKQSLTLKSFIGVTPVNDKRVREGGLEEEVFAHQRRYNTYERREERRGAAEGNEELSVSWDFKKGDSNCQTLLMDQAR